ncbi:ABC transporter ATP-binding protein [Spiroplasma sabaudiense Ar-1343]|uniref:ABC transporter ATP-binding protein n=1 Tax=Spiroplasma sabaudiense Ar-1343 TaxID=1276257 RepID=W6A9V1_9MOLU|nr:ATP-binding cassette domain-containing protein [Spiroplasma sabaudiense]AHI53751.1 ABC transporter ATP-binding protein [Spiroplasma sabaudiense Ar-1343]
MLEIKNLSKNYGDKVGNFDINMLIEDGEVYGIIGPNGAGKTTLIRQILGSIKSSSGSIIINGIDPQKDSKAIMEFTGYVAGEISLYENMTGIQFLKLIASLKKGSQWDFVEKLINHFDLDASRKIKKMSKGMKQKIALIAATMNKPKFLVLDEPTSGLDPIMQEQFNQLILKLRKDSNTTIIICSHIFEEVAKLCSKVGFIKDGKLIEEFKIENNDIEIINERFKKLYVKEQFL